MPDALPVLPVLAAGLLPARPGRDPGALAVEGAPGATRVLPSGAVLLDPAPAGPVTLRAGGAAVRLRPGIHEGAVSAVLPDRILGHARDRTDPSADVTVIAWDAEGAVAHAVARGAAGGRFEMVLPAALALGLPRRLTLGVAGGDCVLGRARVGRPAPTAPAAVPRPGPAAPPRIARRARSEPAIGIKISAPDLREGRAWGDWHFAEALARAFARIGLHARVDTQDAWYAAGAAEDVVLAIRGRHRTRLDPGRINLMWVISHPDRIKDEEYAEFDHVAVASDVFAGELAAAGVAAPSVLHQATDAARFGAARPPEGGRRRECLFVGNSRREYRPMVAWARQTGVPLALYGGGWEGVLEPGAVRAPQVSNADLPAAYAGHLLLLNDHWDSMRSKGFLSNRLFDGAAAGVPILTDPVAGLARVFGDTIAVAGDAAGFAAQVRSCLDDPAPWLARAARAREIVLAGHTFDHRARALAGIVERIAGAKP